MEGGHAMYAVGYEGNMAIVVNSWGEAWGDRGLCYIPFDYIGSPMYGEDYWVIRSFQNR
jgi:C1A family cysteine protease